MVDFSIDCLLPVNSVWKSIGAGCRCASRHFLIGQFCADRCKDILLKCSETFLGRYRMADLKIATQLESVLSCTAERSTISAVYDFYKDDLNEEQLYSRIQQFLESHDLNSSTSNASLKLFVDNRASANSFRSSLCLLRIYLSLFLLPAS